MPAARHSRHYSQKFLSERGNELFSGIKNVLTIRYPYINNFTIINTQDNWKDWRRSLSLFIRLAVR
jgi:hypothetical protein